jgi:type II secretory pathway component GspD/PulD (secretin)
MLRRLYEILAWAGVVCAAAPGLSLAGEEAAPPKGNPKPVAQAEVDSEEGDEAPTPDHEALELLAESRAAYKAGDLEHAREMAERVGEIDDVSASVLNDARLILTQIASKAAANAAASEDSADEAATDEATDDEAPLDDEALADESSMEDGPVAANGDDPNDGGAAPSFGAGSDGATKLTADELYRQGKEALRAGDKDEAYSLYLQAYRSGQPLNARQKTEIREYLSTYAASKTRSRSNPKKKIQLVSGESGTGDNEADPAAEVVERHETEMNQLKTEVRNARYKAEKLAQTDPEGALKVLDDAEAKVQAAGLEAQAAAGLLKGLASSRQGIEYAKKITEPGRDLEKRNEEVMSAIRRERGVKTMVEKEFAEKVDEFNQLIREKRFEEAEVVAKQAQQLKPGDEVAELMVVKSRLAARNHFNSWLKERKEEEFGKQMDDVEETIAKNPFTPDIAMPSAKTWRALTERRAKYKDNPSNYEPSQEEKKIQESLQKDISLHFTDKPLIEVVKFLQQFADVNILLDPAGLDEEGVTPSTPVTIDLDGVKLKTALKFILEPLHLAWTVGDDVLKITSRTRQQGELQTRTYSVADLVVAVKSHNAPDHFRNANPNQLTPGVFGQAPQGFTTANRSRKGGQAFAQIDNGAEGSFPGLPGKDGDSGKGGAQVADFSELMDLIQSTVAPSTWEALGGVGSMRPFNTTLSLVIRQTQAVHEEIGDLLKQLRRLQDLQVTVEVRFITVTDNFFERIGIDFDFNLHDNIGNGVLPNAFGSPLPPYGIGTSIAGAQQGQQGQQGGQQGQQGQQGQAGVAGGNAPFNPGPQRDLINRDRYGRYGAIVGMTPQGQFTQDLDIPFRQGSFPIGVPQFGGFSADAGLSVGLAVLSDIETFFLINAAQGDRRSNLLFAPKVTLFNGQIAQVSDQTQRPYVIGQQPIVGFGSVGYQPIIQTLPDGISLTVLAVISADRRYVRLSLAPLFSVVDPGEPFSFLGGGGAGGGQAGGQGGLGGGGGGFGGGGQGGGGFGGGFGGIGGLGGGQGGGGQGGLGGGQGGQGGQQGQQGQLGGGGAAVTVQQPIFGFTQVQTTVSVPDGGTILLGGVKRLKEGRVMAGVPILNKIPYISRLFKNTGVGREAQSLMMMVTPRIIIQEEEEELLGVEL